MKSKSLTQFPSPNMFTQIWQYWTKFTDENLAFCVPSAKINNEWLGYFQSWKCAPHIKPLIDSLVRLSMIQMLTRLNFWTSVKIFRVSHRYETFFIAKNRNDLSEVVSQYIQYTLWKWLCITGIMHQQGNNRQLYRMSRPAHLGPVAPAPDVVSVVVDLVDGRLQPARSHHGGVGGSSGGGTGGSSSGCGACGGGCCGGGGWWRRTGGTLTGAAQLRPRPLAELLIDVVSVWGCAQHRPPAHAPATGHRTLPAATT